MSGERNKRSRAPERKCMKLSAWPAKHRGPWQASLRPGNPIDGGGGSRASQRDITNKGIENSYGRFLTFLVHHGLLDSTIAPADLISQPIVGSYVEELELFGNKPGTLHVRLEHLREMAKVFAPERDWSFIARAMSRMHTRRKSRDPFKAGRIVTSDELLNLGFQLMEKAEPHPVDVRSLSRYRDGLLIAFLSVVPLRVRNLADLTIGVTLIMRGETWMVRFPPEATKTHRNLDYEWPTFLRPALEKYITIFRPMLLRRSGRWNRDVGDRLWVSIDGSPMTSGSITFQLAYRTKEAFGFSLRGHSFRHAAVTTMALHDPARMRVAAPLLGHTTFETTERNYNTAKTLEAQRQFSDLVLASRRANAQRRPTENPCQFSSTRSKVTRLVQVEQQLKLELD